MKSFRDGVVVKDIVIVIGAELPVAAACACVAAATAAWALLTAVWAELTSVWNLSTTQASECAQYYLRHGTRARLVG